MNGDFERLANESAPPRDGSFGSSRSDARPFSWPEPDPQRAQAPLPPAPPAAAPSASPVAPAPSVVPAPPAPPAVSAPPVAAPPAPPAPPAEPAQAAEPKLESEPAPAAEPASASASAPEPAGESDDEVAATVVTGSAPGSVAPISAQMNPVVPPATDDASDDASDAASDDEELDRTIVVARKAPWVIELSDGRELELVGDDIVLGRKPAAIDGSEILVVPDTTRTLSKSHARLRREGDGWTIEDLGSTNGVFVFDEKGLQVELEPGKPQPASEELILGTLEVRLRKAN